MNDWQQSIIHAVTTNSVHHFIEAVLCVPVTWAGTPASADRSWCADQVVFNSRSQASTWGKLLINHTSPAVREVGLAIAEHCLAPADVLTTCQLLSSDPQWSLREMVAAIAGHLLATDSQLVTPAIHHWTHSQDPYLVRAGVVAVKFAVHRRYPISSAIDLLEPALSVQHTYVRKNLGPYVVGDGLLRVHPQITLSWVNTICTRPCAITRWNAAAVFTAAAAREHIEHAYSVLNKLAADTRPPVRRAVVSAVRRLAHTHSQTIARWARQWQEDPHRHTTGQQIMKVLS